MNDSLSMSKESYYDMCDMLGTEPDPNEVPVEFSDLYLDIQEAYYVYIMLQDTWDQMNGSYTGKNYSGILDILELNEIEDKKLCFRLIKKIDEARSEAIKSKKTAPPTKKPT